MSALNEQNVCPKSRGHDALAGALKKEKARNPACLLAFWRSGWDSNPRAAQHRKLISSQPRYDLFDTAPCLSSLNVLWKKGRHSGQTRKNYEIFKA